MPKFEKGNQAGRRFRPGQSGNPAGRPKLKPIRAAMRELLDVETADGRTAAELLARHAFERAMSRGRDSLAWMIFIRGTVEGHLDAVTDDDEPSITDEKQTGRGPDHEVTT